MGYSILRSYSPLAINKTCLATDLIEFCIPPPSLLLFIYLSYHKVRSVQCTRQKQNKFGSIFDLIFCPVRTGGECKDLLDNNNLNTTESIVNFTFGVYHLARVWVFFFSFFLSFSYQKKRGGECRKGKLVFV